MATETSAKETLRQRAMQELTEFVILTAYLYITLGAVILMKASVLHDHGISYAVWGVAIVKAAVLAKFMLLRLDKLSYDAHMIADRFRQRGMFDVKAPGPVGVGGEAH